MSKPSSSASKPHPRALATPDDVAAYLGVPAKTLTEWRSQRKGPEYLKIGRYVRYDWRAVEIWLPTCKPDNRIASREVT